MYEVTLFSSPRNSPRQAQRARQDLGQGFSHVSSTRCAREERVGPRSASTRTRRGASARKTGQRAPVWDRKRAAAAGFLGQERRADQARGAGAASRWQRRGTRSSGRAATGSVDFASFTLSQIPSFLQSGFPPIHNNRHQCSYRDRDQRAAAAGQNCWVRCGPYSPMMRRAEIARRMRASWRFARARVAPTQRQCFVHDFRSRTEQAGQTSDKASAQPARCARRSFCFRAHRPR